MSVKKKKFKKNSKNKKQEGTERAPWKLNGKSNNNLNGLYDFF